MSKAVDFELAVERIGHILAAVLFRDQLPKNFWQTLSIRDCFEWMSNYPASESRKESVPGTGGTFKKEAYKKAQERVAAIIATSTSFADLELAYNLASRVEWWYSESSTTRDDFKLSVLHRMVSLADTTDHWKLIRRLASEAMYPNTVTKPSLFVSIRSEAATKIFESAKTAQDWWYLRTDEGTEKGTMTSSRFLFGLNDAQRVEVSRQVVLHFRELFGDEEGGGVHECALALEHLPAGALERELAMDYLEKSWMAYLVCEFTEPGSERYQRVFARLKEVSSFNGWLNAYDALTGSKRGFRAICLEQAVKLAKTRKQVEDVIRHLSRKHPYYAELSRKLESIPKEQKSPRRKDRRHSAEVATS